jgi:hypothetical protein
MRLKAFHAAAGQCLMLTSADGHHAMIDAGRAGTLDTLAWPVLRAMAEANERIDLLIVSHTEADDITGVLHLLRAVAAWAVHDFQTTEGGNPTAPKPPVDRPPAIGTVWHNSCRAQLDDLAGPIEAVLGRAEHAKATARVDAATAPSHVVRVVDALDGLAESIAADVELLRLIEDITPIPRNDPFDDLVLLKAPPHVQELGRARLTVIGPSVERFEALRERWRIWLDTLGGAEGRGPRPGPEPRDSGVVDLVQARAAGLAEAERFMTSLASAADSIRSIAPFELTTLNDASITLLAEEDGRSCLVTGEAAEHHLLDGLAAAGRIVDGRFRCNVVQVPHYGSDRNLSGEFFRWVLADDYVFCAYDADHGPDSSVVGTIVETRRDAPEPFTLWFNCSPPRTATGRRSALSDAISAAAAGAAVHPKMSLQVLEDAEPFLDIPV